MEYQGVDIQELSEFLRYQSEPVIVTESFLIEEDLELLHGWTLGKPNYRTEIIQWSPNSVSSKTIKQQRLVPPENWVPEIEST